MQLAAIPVGFLSPLIGYLLLRERSAFLRESIRNALNFQLTVLLASIVVTAGFVAALGSTAVVNASADYYTGLTIALAGLLVIGAAVGVVDAVLCIVGSVRATRGTAFRYPLAIRFVR